MNENNNNVKFYLNDPADWNVAGGKNNNKKKSKNFEESVEDIGDSCDDEYVNTIRTIIKSCNTNIMVIIRGLPGSGKSYLSSYVFLFLRLCCCLLKICFFVFVF
jgi:hypothetical protein